MSLIIIYLSPNINKRLRMKKLVLFAAVLAVGVSSCSKDDDNNTPAELAGKWEYAQQGAVLMGQEILQAYTHEEGCSKDFMILSASTVADHSFIGTACTEDIETSNYTRNGNTLTMMVDGEMETAEIVQLDNTTLKIKVTENLEGQSVGYLTVFTRK